MEGPRRRKLGLLMKLVAYSSSYIGPLLQEANILISLELGIRIAREIRTKKKEKAFIGHKIAIFGPSFSAK